jgi:hypothetical protein
VTVTNSGGGPLHISSVVLGGANSGDFILTNGCTTSTYAVNATCALGVSFAPLASGARSATVTLTDDAANSPQVINLGGFANPALTTAGCGGGSAMLTTTPPQIVTPQGQFTIIVTPSATSANSKPLQLQPIQLTLTVN